MSENTSTTETTAHTYAKGSWQESLEKSAVLMGKSTEARKKASALLWSGAQAAIAEWTPKADTDSTGETLYGSIIDVLGTKRKGDASKIKTVAVATVRHGLVLASHENLSKAYAEAIRLTKTVADEAAEDDAAEKAIEALAANVPNSTTTVEGAALILLGKGIDGAVVAILDALGANNEAAHRAFMRALSSEIADRVQAAKPKPVAKAAGPKTGATQATKAAAPKATVADGATKAKATPAKKAAPKAKATPVSASKGDPNKKALPKATPVKATPVPVAKAG